MYMYMYMYMCMYMVLPYRRSSKSRPGRTWPQGFRYLSTSTSLSFWGGAPKPETRKGFRFGLNPPL